MTLVLKWRNKISKKIFPILSLLIVAAMALAACAPAATPTEAPPTEAPPEATEEPVATEMPMETEEPTMGFTCTISLWHSFNENEMESLIGVTTAFKETNPDVEFDFLFSPPDDIRGKFETAAATGGGPSILYGSADWGPSMYDALLLTDVSEFASDEFLATINPAALGSVQYSDALIGLPINVKGVLMYRNASIIPDAPSTFDELVEMAQAATSGDVIGADLEYGLFFSAGHLYGLGGALLDAEGDPTFNDEKGVEWVEMIKRFEETGLVENNNNNDVNLFLESKAGIIIDVLWNAAPLAEGIGAENLVIDPWPAGMSGYVQTNILFMNANLTGDDAECTWAFMEFMLSPESQVIFSDPAMAGNIPSILGVEVTDPIQQQALAAFEGGTAFPVIPEMGAYWDPVNNALLSVIEKGTDPAEALQAAHDAVVVKIAEIREE
jgi:arabinogalactan oligomer/maltooligosaccharide transport system substrate-binding protein